MDLTMTASHSKDEETDTEAAIKEAARELGYSEDEMGEVLEAVSGFDRAFLLLKDREGTKVSTSVLVLSGAAQLAKNLSRSFFSTSMSFEKQGKPMDWFRVCPNDFSTFREMFMILWPDQAGDGRLDSEQDFLNWFNDFVDKGIETYGEHLFEDDREANRITSFGEIAALVNDAFFLSLGRVSNEA